MKKIKSFSIEGPIKGICKSHGIWAQDAEKNSMMPVCYFLKPKWMTKEQFKKIIDSMKYLQLPGEL